jgi:hypothetical protein
MVRSFVFDQGDPSSASSFELKNIEGISDGDQKLWVVNKHSDESP